MASILDIARKAGVSHGTVSNVLNKKGNVSAKKIKLVEEAALELNYSVNPQAKVLRKGKSNQIAVIVSDYNIDEYNYFYRGLEEVALLNGLSVDIYEAPETEEKFNELLVSFGVFQYAKIITVGVDYQLNSTLKKQFSSILLSLDNYLESNNFNIYSEIDRHISIHTTTVKDSIFILPPPLFIGGKQENSTVVSLSMNETQIREIASYERLIFVSSLSFKIFNQISTFFGIKVTSEIICLGEEISDLPDVMILSNFYEFGKRFAEDVINENYSTLPSFFSYPNFVTERKNEGKVIRLISNNNPTAQALQNIVSAFYYKTGIKVEITIADHDELYEIINSDAIHDYDFIRIDLSLFPFYAEKLFLKIDSVKSFQGSDDIFQKVFNKVVHDDQSHYGIPFDTSIQTMFYRSDLLEDELFKRLYFEKYKVKFEFPETIKNYIKVCRFIAENTSEFNFKFGNSTNLADPNVISSEFLMIYYGLGGRLVGSKGVQLNTKIALKALKDYYELSTVSSHNFDKWFGKGIQDYGEGSIAMIFGYSNQLAHVRKYDVIANSKVAKIPGNMPMLGGGILSQINKVKTDTRNDEFMDWFLNPYTKFIISEHGGIPANERLISNYAINKKHAHLLESLENINQAVRETYDNTGTPINIYKFERRIGQLIQSNFGMEPSELIRLINQELTVV